MPRYSLCEKIGDLSHTRRYKPASWPDEAYVSGVAYKFVENGDDVRMSEWGLTVRLLTPNRSR